MKRHNVPHTVAFKPTVIGELVMPGNGISINGKQGPSPG